MEDRAFYCGIAQAYCIAPRTRGAWIWKSYDMKHDCGDIVCSTCTCVIYEGVPKVRLFGALWNYCPKCGSDNRKEPAP